MIFSKYFDKSLWLILAGDEKNRDAIVNFIKDIPYELYEKISEELRKFDGYVNNNVNVLDRDFSDNLVELFVSNGYKYWFNVDMVLETFNIGRSFNNVLDIDITLFLNGGHNANDEHILGYVNFGNSKLRSVCYELSDSLFGQKVVSFIIGKIRKYKNVDVQSIPDDIKVTDLDKVNRHVRSRVKKRYY